MRFVLDGDTIEVGARLRVRLLGIDAPEVGAGLDTPAAFAVEARHHLQSLLAQRYVHLETETDTTDKYGRRLAYVFRDDGLFVNAEMLRAGLARVSARKPLRRLEELHRAEQSAQQARRGLWGDRPAIPAPREPRHRFRKTAPRRPRRSRSARRHTAHSEPEAEARPALSPNDRHDRLTERRGTIGDDASERVRR